MVSAVETVSLDYRCWYGSERKAKVSFSHRAAQAGPAGIARRHRIHLAQTARPHPFRRALQRVASASRPDMRVLGADSPKATSESATRPLPEDLCGAA